EFVVLLRETVERGILESRCRELLKKCNTVIKQCGITLSIGCVIFSGNYSFDDIFKEVDATLYQVKNSGKNNYKIVRKDYPENF
ncbi:MAG: diguanylate cyclase, partial [Oscillospiraceae bacterium]